MEVTKKVVNDIINNRVCGHCERSVKVNLPVLFLIAANIIHRQKASRESVVGKFKGEHNLT